jgi:cytochrome c oxidase subunit III
MAVMGDVLPYRPPSAPRETTAFLGMVLFLGSWAMLFGALFFAYAFVRARSAVWPPADVPRLPVALPALNTVLLAASSASLQFGIHSVRRARPRNLGWAMVAAWILGAVFLAVQLHLWSSLHAQGLRPDTGGQYGSVFYGLTWFHALHVAVGLLGLGAVAFNAFRGRYSATRFLPVRLWTMYWHFVGVVWALMFATIFLV